MRGFKANQADKDQFESGNITALRLVAKPVHGTANTAFAGVVVDFTKVICKLFLLRNGVQHQIFSDEALPLAIATGFDEGTFDEVKGGGTPYLRKVLAAAGGVFEELMVTCRINLPCIVNLVDGDILTVELKDKGAFSAACDVAKSGFDWELEEGVGNSLGIPFIDVEMITAGQSSSTIECGNGVKKVFFVNNDKFTVLRADQVIDSVDINADKLKRSDEWAELLLMRVDEFKSSTLADQRNQCFKILDVDRDAKLLVPGDATDDVQYHKTKVKFNFIAANVIAAKNYVVKVGIKADTRTAAAGFQRNAKHAEQNAAQVIG